MDEPSVPLLRDVTFRITEKGDFIGLDMACADGSTRSIAMPAALAAKLTAGFLWSAEEAARRGQRVELADAALGHLQASAPVVKAFDIVGGGGAPVLDLEIGAAHVCVRFSREGAAALHQALGLYLSGQSGAAS